MSGGAYGYAFRQIERFAHQIRGNTAKRRVYIKMLLDVADLAKKIEWTDSSDTSEESAEEALDNFFSKWKIPVE